MQSSQPINAKSTPGRIEMKKSSLVILILSFVVIVGFLSGFHLTKEFVMYLQWAIKNNEYLEGAYLSVGTVGISLLDLCGSILACRKYREATQGSKIWFEVFVACLFSQFGGTTLTGLILGQTPSWMMSHTALPAFFLAYWMTFCCPFDAFFKLTKSRHILFLICLGAAVSSGHSVTSWGVDKVLFNQFHINSQRISQSLFTCLVCGTLSGSGGSLLSDWFGFLRNPSFTLTQTPKVFGQELLASATLNRSFLLACLYYLLTTANHLPWTTPLISRAEGHLVIGSLQVLNFIVQWCDPEIDIFQLFSWALRRILCVDDMVHFTNKMTMEAVTVVEGSENVLKKRDEVDEVLSSTGEDDATAAAAAAEVKKSEITQSIHQGQDGRHSLSKRSRGRVSKVGA